MTQSHSPVPRSGLGTHLVPVAALLAAWILALGCGDASSPGVSERVTIVAGDNQSAVAGSAVSVDPIIEVRTPDGRPLSGIPVRFAANQGGGLPIDTLVQTDAVGRANTSWVVGPAPGVENRLRVTAGSTTVELKATVTAPQPGQTYRGRNGYIEYLPGELPLIITAPHGGMVQPAEIPDRTEGTFGRDINTEELAHAIANAFEAATGKRPHLVICKLRRTKVDANREIVEAAQGNRFAERAWKEFHAFTEGARHTVATAHARGLYVDLHGHAHTIARLELGYTLTAEELALSDEGLAGLIDQTSVRAVARRSALSFAVLLRGAPSLGALFEAEGFPAVPSVTQPNPGTEPYFSGGYNTGRHGSRNGGTIDGVQIESHFTGVRDTPDNRQRFAIATVNVLLQFLSQHYGFSE